MFMNIMGRGFRPIWPDQRLGPKTYPDQHKRWLQRVVVGDGVLPGVLLGVCSERVLCVRMASLDRVIHPSGRVAFRVRWREGGRQRSLSFTSRREAEGFRRQLELVAQHRRLAARQARQAQALAGDS
jgi:hypothetical protein